MDEKMIFKNAVRKINRARKAEGKEPIRYAVDFGKKIHVSRNCGEMMLPISLLKGEDSPDEF